MENSEKSPQPVTGPSAVAVILERFQEMVKQGEVQALLIGFVKTDGAAAVQSTPMSPVMMNHLCRLIDRRVSREYDRALAQGNGAQANGARAVPETARQAAAQLPRKVRREVQARQRNLQKRAEKEARKQAASASLIRKPSAAANGQ